MSSHGAHIHAGIFVTSSAENRFQSALDGQNVNHEGGPVNRGAQNDCNLSKRFEIFVTNAMVHKNQDNILIVQHHKLRDQLFTTNK